MNEKLIESFNKYVDNYDKSIKEINLKYNHSIAVMNLMGELAFRLNLSNEEIFLARVIGLLHDIGRFKQWEDYKSYSDTKTGFDHAEKGADYLFKEGHIRDYIDIDTYDNIIEKAIRNHSKYMLPNDLNEKELFFAKMIRDIDKIDIYKQIAVNYNYKFDAKEVTEEVISAFKEEKSVDKKITKTDTDRTLLVLAFIFDFYFDQSFDILVSEDNFDLFLSTIEVSEDSEKLFNKIKEICFDKINRGIGDKDVR